MIHVDQGSPIQVQGARLWAYQRGVTLDFSRPGKPTDNAFIESFNGKFRAECLNAHWFMSLDDARRKCEAWRRDYNEERPHSAIGNKAPTAQRDRPVLDSATTDAILKMKRSPLSFLPVVPVTPKAAPVIFFEEFR
jgi:putative transposase